MLGERILATLRFFDLQDCPLTLLEIHRFLLPESGALLGMLGNDWEFIRPAVPPACPRVTMSDILSCLEGELQHRVVGEEGFFALAGRGSLIRLRRENYFLAIRREQLIKTFVPGLRRLLFVRGVALLGSQALGLPKNQSDIDLLIITDRHFMWLARLLATGYFQLLGLRRHGHKVANRFCLNHYLIEGASLDFDRNLYTAAEYLKARPLVGGEAVRRFQLNNWFWLSGFFPNAGLPFLRQETEQVGKFWEKLLQNTFGRWLERLVKKPQIARIDSGEFIVVSDAELSFHPQNRKRQLFERFFKFQK